MLDTSSLLQQYNLNHMRTLNQLILTNLLLKQQKDVQMVKAVSTDPTLFPEASTIFAARKTIIVDVDSPFEDRAKSFKFSSLWNKVESLYIMLQIQSESVNLEKVTSQ
jgi:hypothetical protein